MTIKDLIFKQSNKIQVADVSAARVDNVSASSVNTEQDDDLSNNAIHISRNKPLDFSDEGGNVEFSAKIAPVNKSNNPSLSKDDLQAKTIAKLSDIINNLDDVNEAGHINNIEFKNVTQQINDKVAAQVGNSVDGIHELGFDGPAREEDVSFELLDGSDASKPVLDYWTLGQGTPVPEGDLRHNLRISMKVTPKSHNETQDGKALKSYSLADPVEIKDDAGFSTNMCHDVNLVTNGYDVKPAKAVFANGYIAKFEETEETNDQGKTIYLMEIDVPVVNPVMKPDGKYIIGGTESSVAVGNLPYTSAVSGVIYSHLQLAHLHSYSADELKLGTVLVDNLILNPDFATSNYWFNKGAFKHITFGRFVSSDDFTAYYNDTEKYKCPSDILEIQVGMLRMASTYHRRFAVGQVDESFVESTLKKTDADGDYSDGPPAVSSTYDITANLIGDVEINDNLSSYYRYHRQFSPWDGNLPAMTVFINPHEAASNEDGTPWLTSGYPSWMVTFLGEDDANLGNKYLSTSSSFMFPMPQQGAYQTGTMSKLRDQYIMANEQADYYDEAGVAYEGSDSYNEMIIPAGTVKLRWDQREGQSANITESRFPKHIYVEGEKTRVPWVDASTALSATGGKYFFPNACEIKTIGDRYFICSPKIKLTNVYRIMYVPPLEKWCPTVSYYDRQLFEDTMGGLNYPFNKEITLDVSDLNVTPGDSIFDSRRCRKYTVSEDSTISFTSDNTVQNCIASDTFDECFIMSENEESSLTSLFWKSNNSTMGAQQQLGDAVNPASTHEFSASLKQVISDTESLRRLENAWGCNYDFEINQTFEARDGKFYKINVTVDDQNPDNMFMRKTQCKLNVDMSDNITGPFTRLLSNKDADIVSVLDEGGELFEREDRCFTMLLRCQYEVTDQDSFSQVSSSIKLNDNCEGSFKISKRDDQSYAMDDRIPNGRSMSKKEMNAYMSRRVGWFQLNNSSGIRPYDNNGKMMATQIGKGLYAVQNYATLFDYFMESYNTPGWRRSVWNMVFNIDGKEFNVPWKFVSNVPENGISIIRVDDADLPEELNVPPARFSTIQDHQSVQEGETLCYYKTFGTYRNSYAQYVIPQCLMNYHEKTAEEEYSHAAYAGRTVAISRDNFLSYNEWDPIGTGSGMPSVYLNRTTKTFTESVSGIFVPCRIGCWKNCCI